MLVLPQISFNAPIEDISNIIQECGQEAGAMTVTDLPCAPFADIQSVFSKLTDNPDLGQRLNAAYTNNLVYKDSFAMGNGTPDTDMKRVLDLSPERIAQIESPKEGWVNPTKPWVNPFSWVNPV